MSESKVVYKAKVVRYGTSLYVVIPSYIRKLLNISEGDEVVVSVSK